MIRVYETPTHLTLLVHSRKQKITITQRYTDAVELRQAVKAVKPLPMKTLTRSQILTITGGDSEDKPVGTLLYDQRPTGRQATTRLGEQFLKLGKARTAHHEWTEKELHLILAYEGKPLTSLLQALPHHSQGSIRQKLNAAGYSVYQGVIRIKMMERERWTHQEETLIINSLAKHDRDYTFHLLPNRTPYAIMGLLSRRGYTSSGTHFGYPLHEETPSKNAKSSGQPWTEEEKTLLENTIPQGRAAVRKALPTRSMVSISMQAYKMGYSLGTYTYGQPAHAHKMVAHWTPQDVRKLISTVNRGGNVYEAFPQRPKTNIMYKLRSLGYEVDSTGSPLTRGTLLNLLDAYVHTADGRKTTIHIDFNDGGAFSYQPE